MTISDVAIKRSVFTWMLMFALIFFGGLTFKRMGVSQLPDVDFPVVSVSVRLDGASPEVMEVDVVDTLEGALMTVEGILSVTSSSKTGSASLTAEFDLDKDIDLAVQEIQTAIARVQSRLPKEIDPPSVRKSNPESQPIMWLAVTSDRLERRDLMTLVRDRVRDKFSTVSGVGEVFVGGYNEPELRVWLSTDKLRRNYLTASDILNTIQQEHAELPGGRLETSKIEYNIRTLGEAPTAEEFGRITINRRGGGPNYRPVPLNQIGQVEDGMAERRSISRSNGNTAVGLGVRKQPGSNAVDVAHAVKERMEEIRQILPEGVEIGIRFDSTVFIEEAVGELNHTLMWSAILTALVCWLFLGSLSATINVVLAIPTSIVGSFIVLYALGFTLNIFTLLALSLAIGVVVDDAIMVLENIVRHKEMGKSRMESAIFGTREVTFAAMAATAAIIAIFLPVAFMSGIIGKYFFQFGVTLSVAVALSLLEALTLTPMRCSRFLNVEERTSWIGRNVEHAFEWCAGLYKKIIPGLIRMRWLVLIGSVAFFAGSLYFLVILTKEFVPAQDQSRLMIRVQTPVGTALDETDLYMQEIEDYFAKQEEVEGTFVSVGGFGGGEVNTGMIFLTLKSPKVRPKHTDLIAKYRKELPKKDGSRISVQDPSLSGFSSNSRGLPVEFTVRGPDWEGLVDASEKMQEAMKDSGMMVDVDSNYRAGQPEIVIKPDRAKARERGVAVYDIAQTINALMGGVIAGKYSKDGHRHDVKIRLVEGERQRPEDIKNLFVRNNRGELIGLDEVAIIEERKSLQAITRENRERAINIMSNLSPGASQEKALQFIQKKAKEILPEGYYVSISGQSKTFGESISSLWFALGLGVIVAYMILASQFNSFIHPVTVLIALPFSATGAFIALWLTGQTLNIYSMIGLVLLMGIVKKNSILLVDFTNQMKDKGLKTRDALIEACPLRLRPILMTSMATIAGALPAALAVGPGAESRIPMAITVIGGVIVSTLLTLLVVPCVYFMLDRIENKLSDKTEIAPHLLAGE